MKTILVLLAVLAFSSSKTIEQEVQIDKFFELTDLNVFLEPNDNLLIKIIGDFLYDKPLIQESSVNFKNITMVNKTFKQNVVMKNNDFVKITNATFELKFKFEGYYEVIIMLPFGKGLSKDIKEVKYITFKVNVHEKKKEEETKEEEEETKEKKEETKEGVDKNESGQENGDKKKDILEELIKIGKIIYEDLKEAKIIV